MMDSAKSMGNSYTFRLIAVVSMMLGMNILILNFCNWMECYQITFVNLFRGNLICNACTEVSYHIYSYQTSLYFTIGGLFLKFMTETINKCVDGLMV